MMAASEDARGVGRSPVSGGGRLRFRPPFLRAAREGGRFLPPGPFDERSAPAASREFPALPKLSPCRGPGRSTW